METLSFNTVEPLDFSSPYDKYVTDLRRHYEHNLQKIAGIQPSDDFIGVREKIAQEDEEIETADYIQATANNLSENKIGVKDASGLIQNYQATKNSPDTSLEKRAVESIFGELVADDPEMYAEYMNNPGEYQAKINYSTNLLQLDRMFEDYQNAFVSKENRGKFLAQAGAELVTSWGASIFKFGTLVEGSKQFYKVAKLRNILNIKEDDVITPEGLGNSLRNVIYTKAKSLKPEEFNEWLSSELKPVIDDMPLIYQSEVLEKLEGYQPIDNIFLISDLVDDFSTIAKLAKTGDKAQAAKYTGDYKKAIDDVLSKRDEVISSTGSANPAKTSVLKNKKKVKKEVVKKVVEEKTEEAVKNIDDVEEKNLARDLIELEEMNEISEPVNKKVIDHKSWADQNATTIGRADGTPFTSYEEASRAARDITLKNIEEVFGGRVISAWSKTDYTSPSLDYMFSGEGGVAFSAGIYGTYQSPKTAMNSAINYKNQFIGYVPDAVRKKDLDQYVKHLNKTYGISLTNTEDISLNAGLTLDSIIGDFKNLRKDRFSIKQSFKILKERYERELKESLEYQVLYEKALSDGIQDPHGQVVKDLLTIPGAIDEGHFTHPMYKVAVLDYVTKGAKLNKEPVNKFFIFKPRLDKYYIGSERVGFKDDIVKYKTMNNLYKYMMDNFTYDGKLLNPMSGGKKFESVDEVNKWLLDNVYETSDDRFELKLDIIEDAIVNQLLFKNKKVLPDYNDYTKEALKILKDEIGFGGWWHSDINLVTNDPSDLTPFYTMEPVIKGGKVTYKPRIDNEELLKYYAEPVQIDNKWFVKKYAGDENFIKIEGN